MVNKNGHDDSDSKVARFPDSRERAEFERRMKAANDRAPQQASSSEPILNLPPAVKALCLVLIVIQAIMTVLPDETIGMVFENLAFYATRYSGDRPFGWQGAVAPFTYMLLHGGWLHIAINVATLAAFGAGLEKTIGAKKFLLLFVATGVIGAFTHVLFYPGSDMPLVGASGGISGLFGAVLMMAQQRGLMGGYRRLLPFVAVWIVISLFFGFFGMPGAEGPIAWTAHIGGFIAGLLLYVPLARSKILN